MGYCRCNRTYLQVTHPFLDLGLPALRCVVDEADRGVLGLASSMRTTLGVKGDKTGRAVPYPRSQSDAVGY